jgi:hypothetical protein
MDLDKNRKMDWFFNQWVYGSEVPTYELAYKLTPGDNGQTVLTAQITQSGVPDDFVMPVPIYLEMNGQVMRLGSLSVKGSTTSETVQVPLSFKPERALLNANHDILAASVTVKPLP